MAPASDPATPEPAEFWRGKLQRLVASSSGELQSIEAELAAARAVRASGGDDDEHDPDGIPLSSVLQLLEGQKMRAVEQARAANDALVDLAHGRYGICRRCARDIPSARLEVKPTSGTCVACAR